MKTVHIYGGAPTNSPIPAMEPGDEKWGINNLWSLPSLRPRFEGWTRWFDLHDSGHIQARKRQMYPWLCAQTLPIVRWEVDPAMPSSVRYPREAVLAKFQTRLFCSSFDWLMALAILESFQRVHLYGWRMWHPSYQHQVKSGQFWIQQAQKAGITIENHSKSSLFIVKHDLVAPDTSRCLMYGIETTDRSKLYSHRFTK